MLISSNGRSSGFIVGDLVEGMEGLKILVKEYFGLIKIFQKPKDQ